MLPAVLFGPYGAFRDLAFVFEHLDGNRGLYDGLSREEYVDEFRIDDILFERFLDYLVSQRLKMNFYDFEGRIKLYLKAALAEQLYGPNLSAKIRSNADTMLQQVLEIDAPAALAQKETTRIRATDH